MLLKVKAIGFSKNFFKKAPEEPGIYIFMDSLKTPIYVGKSKNLRKRLYSYTLKLLDSKTLKMVSSVYYYSFIKVSSEIEALILEAKLVRKLSPKYNIQLKDDKSPLYVTITKDYYPRVKTKRRSSFGPNDKYIYGPFLSTTSINFVLRNLRRIFPYATHIPEKRKCFYSHINLCNPCPSEIEVMSQVEKLLARNKYLSNIMSINKILSGNTRDLINDLNEQMVLFSNKQDFESAKSIKERIDKLLDVTKTTIPGDYYIENPNLIEGIRKNELFSLKIVLKNHIFPIKSLERIECYDAAHLNGSFVTASMITFSKGEPNKNYYRHFKIKQKKGCSDVFSMQEVSKRRIRHFEDWGKPDLVLVDGGKNQVDAAQHVFYNFHIPVIGIAKLSSSLVIPISISENRYAYESIKIDNKMFNNLVMRLKDEAHRFSRKLHHKLLHDSYGLV